MRAEFGEMKVYINRDLPWSDRFKLYIVKKEANRDLLLDAEGNWHTLEPGCVVSNDFKHIIIPEGALKGIVEAIASNFGVLPDKVQFAEDELKAVKRHLEDMRILLFNTLGIKNNPDLKTLNERMMEK